MSRDPEPEDRGWRPNPVVLGAAVGVFVLILVVLLVVLLQDSGQDDVSDPLTGRPVTPTASPTTPSTTPPTTPATTPPVTPATTPPTPQEPAEREPTDADAAAFAESYQPRGGEQVQRVAVDVTGDGRREVVIAALVAGVSRVDVAVWDGSEYRVIFSGEGGRAETLADLIVHDFTGDGAREIVTVERSGERGESLSVYGWDGRSFSPQRAVGGCWAGSHTYGVTGARIEVGRIDATCDVPDLPLAAQPVDVYRWNGSAWEFERREAGA